MESYHEQILWVVPVGGDATSAADTDIQASSEAPGRWVSAYAVPKMDCPSEERMIRLALNGFEEIRALSFDLSNRRAEVVHDGEVEPVTSKLKTLGLGASLQETVAANPETIKAAEFSAASAKQESGDPALVARHQCTSVRGGK